MIQASELRIGNWMKRDTQPEGFQIDSSSFLIVERHPELYEPIPITSEILEQCGLEKDKYPPANVWSDGSVIVFYKEPKDCEILEGFYTTYWHSAVRLEYLHQLQNLYYALTSNELTINL